MNNIMVCVTQQKTCDRLIKYGADQINGDDGELYVLHIAKEGFNFLGNDADGEALEYLFEKAKAYGADLTVIRSNNILNTLVSQAKKNKITKVIMGQSGEADAKNDVAANLEKQIKGKIEIDIVPA